MGIGTLLRYLLGQRQAILDIAADRHAVWIGLLFVLSAGFAREYDGEDLLHQPWHLLIPLAASLGSSIILFVLTWGVAKLKRAPGPGLFTAYRSFLGLFWMTAPLAWLYAIPYERFLTPYEATVANLITLGVVSVWRVALMMRVVSVLMGYHWQGSFVVMLHADALAVTAMQFVPVPLLDIMGGIRLTPSEQLIQGVAGNVVVLGTLSLPLWLGISLVVWYRSRPAWQAGTASPATTRPLWVLAAASVLVWIPILPVTQPQQILRRQVEHEMEQGRIADGLLILSQHSRNDFPEHWELPPANRYGKHRPHLLDVMAVIAEEPPAAWVRAIYLQRFEDWLLEEYVSEGDIHRVVQVIRRIPEGRAVYERLKKHDRVDKLLEAIERAVPPER